MLVLKVIKVLSSENKFSKGSGRQYRAFRLMIDNPYFDENGMHPSTRIVYASADSDFLFKVNEGATFVFITKNKDNQIWLNGLAS